MRSGEWSYQLTCAVVLLAFASGCEPWGAPKDEPPSGVQITDFETLFGQHCAGCHGNDGKDGPVRPINDPLYLALIPKGSLRSVIEHGRQGTSMPAWLQSEGGPLTEKQVNILVDGIEQNWSRNVDLHGTKLPPYDAGDEKADAANGKKLFLRDCFMCHGKGAAVGPVTDPAYLTLASNQALRASIITGRPDLGMPSYQYLNMGRPLTSQDVTDLVGYLASLRPAAPEAGAHAIENGNQGGGK